MQEVYGENATPLMQHQSPPADWRPDGVNPLAWLLQAEIITVCGNAKPMN